MAVSVASYNKKYLRMKPEVKQIFADLEELLDYCRMSHPAIKFDPADLYRPRSLVWQGFMKKKKRDQRLAAEQQQTTSQTGK